MTDPDIIDRIDALVDEQLAEGEHASDYLTGDHKYPRCPHCGRHWHGLPITERIATMYDIGRIDPEYTLAEDDSPVVCEGSDFIGPQRAPAGGHGMWVPIGRFVHIPLHIHADDTPVYPQWSTVGVGHFSIVIRPDPGPMRSWAAMFRQLSEYLESITRDILGPTITLYDQCFQPIWRTTACPDLEHIPEIDVKFGPENWIHEIQRLPPPTLQFPRSLGTYRLMTPLQADVNRLWPDFTAPDYPIPESPGYDFSHLADEQPPTAGPDHTRNRRNR
ncbi:uncharacterized protein RMCC_1374 [Mycolicibacterium canariasense]|uniref:Uncharacterized protein n=1 Tax=Mycolicibacterium canariasense TaxID=228230 RepID=A0A100WAD6_MYCCR|nr:hypothetical protein [Mycolicibacterium canariasense]MCV7208805.1 hypothetical protein [Mycolicibacterium canariasense]ORV07130.1 hypothetical protein AWB94_14100 [Mycolicibacterium canariasense]GAS94408.1 uncharacterized protein RMCC_1374 [Mycolicibacterium canariasense]